MSLGVLIYAVYAARRQGVRARPGEPRQARRHVPLGRVTVRRLLAGASESEEAGAAGADAEDAPPSLQGLGGLPRTRRDGRGQVVGGGVDAGRLHLVVGGFRFHHFVLSLRGRGGGTGAASVNHRRACARALLFPFFVFLFFSVDCAPPAPPGAEGPDPPPRPCHPTGGEHLHPTDWAHGRPKGGARDRPRRSTGIRYRTLGGRGGTRPLNALATPALLARPRSQCRRQPPKTCRRNNKKFAKERGQSETKAGGTSAGIKRS